MSNGIVLYRGPSELDREPIVVIATGLESKSSNKKTGGDLIQTWILREDVSPTEAVKSGEDSSICGQCPHRGSNRLVDGQMVNQGRSCYVTVHQAPLNVWKAYKRGVYGTGPIVGVIGKLVRMGSYGDPAAVPFKYWEVVMHWAKGGTGYTHQWRTCDPRLKQYCMASVDNLAEAVEAKLAGWRTFRVKAGVDPIGTAVGVHQTYEVICPASKEAGFKTTCDTCLACGGLASKAKANIVINAHGAAGKVGNFTRRSA